MSSEQTVARGAALGVRYDPTDKLINEVACDSYERSDAYLEHLAHCQTGATLTTGDTAASA